MDRNIDRLATALKSLVKTEEDRIWMVQVIAALDVRYNLSAKMVKEPGLEEIIRQLFGRIAIAFDGLSEVKGKKILDIACGSNTSKAPPMIFANFPFGAKEVSVPPDTSYTALFEPWFCRILLELDAEPIGVDIGDLEAEGFTHYKVDLGHKGALNFLPSHSFDALQDSRLFGSPEFTSQFPIPADRMEIAGEIRHQERRLLKAGGTVIHSDAEDLASRNY